ncbi:hypothetical protein PNP85_09825 [Halobacterium salinarum]|uniref:hypothetical protein n=1 Tax=Halobacterium TaxID=2239 RepID=UPI0019658861|nr:MULTISPECIES: hypothetical protein [Halobacterium]MCF2164784.1 hypothetical protein [Halobacterium salinarum]MCF2168203.1 hypothetical protein [Halobacterium salinarum]MDL0128722.1 hypothetical protein [Halobacterium salinarum]MDL0133128.1 hypothetical protein [Halobacterium salinarum]MDL0139799.1 hypothetical protein [Halobacterium salinarum]
MSDNPVNGIEIPEPDYESIAGSLPSQETIDSATDAIQKAKKRFERARKGAEKHINIGPPWDYDPSDYSPSDEASYHAFRWAHEGQISLQETGDSELETIAEQIEYGSKMLAEDSSNDDIQGFNSGILALISALDGLIIWLCEYDSNTPADRTNANGEDIYHSGSKKDVLKRMYDQHSVFGVENGQGSEFKNKWVDFWEHRHRIMHGEPDAYYDDNVGVATLFFVGLTAYVVKEQYEALNP